MDDTQIENPVGGSAETPIPAQASQEQILSGMLTVLVSRMGGRVVLSHAENKRTFERLMKQNKVITMRFNKAEIILELTQIAQPVVKPETAVIDSAEH